MNINFKKNGQPFVNLITVVPVVEADGDVNYFIGFQVDIQSQAKGILTKLDDGSYVFDNRQSSFENTHEDIKQESFSSWNTFQVEESIAMKFSEIGLLKRAEGWSSGDGLIDHIPDLVLILSSRGTILYTSPNCKNLTGYESHELAGQKLNNFVYPGNQQSFHLSSPYP